MIEFVFFLKNSRDGESSLRFFIILPSRFLILLWPKGSFYFQLIFDFKKHFRGVNKKKVSQTLIVSLHAACSVTLSSLTLWDPMDCSSPGSTIHEIFQARILEWVAMPFSRGSSQPRDQTHISYVSCIGRSILYL